jgi:hypothetical protein
VRVAPGKDVIELPVEVCSALRNQDSARALVFHGPDEAFDQGDVSVLPDSTVPRADSFAATLALEGRAPEEA